MGGLQGSPGSNSGVTDVRYQKLATEYAKIRAQFGVVKKALIEEQGKNAEVRIFCKIHLISV